MTSIEAKFSHISVVAFQSRAVELTLKRFEGHKEGEGSKQQQTAKALRQGLGQAF